MSKAMIREPRSVRCQCLFISLACVRCGDELELFDGPSVTADLLPTKLPKGKASLCNAWPRVYPRDKHAPGEPLP
jgi:hypothetical protein